MIVVKETKHGFASTIDWNCNFCGALSSLKTSPKKNKEHEVNTRMITALKTSSTGGSYKVCETLATHLDMPTITRNAFFARSKAIGSVIQKVAKKNTEVALQGIVTLILHHVDRRNYFDTKYWQRDG